MIPRILQTSGGRPMNIFIILVSIFLSACTAFGPHDTSAKTGNVNSELPLNSARNVAANDKSVDLKGLSQQQIREKEIVYGQGGANLLLGDTEDQALASLGKPHDLFVYERPCNISEWIWVDEGDTGNGITAYLQNGKIFQLKFADSRIKTKDEITYRTSVKHLIESYIRRNELEEFTLKITDGDFAPDFPHYLVDRENGVAFKINHRKDESRDEVWAIEIFQPKGNFAPNGCILDQSKYVKTQ